MRYFTLTKHPTSGCVQLPFGSNGRFNPYFKNVRYLALALLIITPLLLPAYEVKETVIWQEAKDGYQIHMIRKVEKFDDGRVKTTHRKVKVYDK